MEKLIEKLNGIEILQNDAGKYGLRDTIGGGRIRWTYRTLDAARHTAQLVSAENDKLDGAR